MSKALEFLNERSNPLEVAEILDKSRISGWRILAGKQTITLENIELLVKHFENRKPKLTYQMFFE